MYIGTLEVKNSKGLWFPEYVFKDEDKEKVYADIKAKLEQMIDIYKDTNIPIEGHRCSVHPEGFWDAFGLEEDMEV